MNIDLLTGSEEPGTSSRAAIKFDTSTTTATTAEVAPDLSEQLSTVDKAAPTILDTSQEQTDASSSFSSKSPTMEDTDLPKDMVLTSCQNNALKGEIDVKQPASVVNPGTPAAAPTSNRKPSNPPVTDSDGLKEAESAPAETNDSTITDVTKQVARLPLLAALGWLDDEDNGKGIEVTAEDDAGVQMLLMMRHNEGKDRPRSRPTPLSKVANKAAVIGLKLVTTSNLSPSRGLPSSHPYYRSTRVLASPRTQDARNSASMPVEKAGSDGKSGSNDPPRQLQYAKPDQLVKNQPDIKSEQQRPRQNGVYHYPIPPRTPLDRKDNGKEIERPQLSPRVYIPPPVFSPRRYHSNGAISTQASLAAQRDAVVHSRSQASEKPQRYELSAATFLQSLHQPYKPGTPPAGPTFREMQPKYSEYFGAGDAPLPSPIRESFVRSEPASKRNVQPLAKTPAPRLVYAPCDDPQPRGEFPLEAQRLKHEIRRDFRVYPGFTSGYKRPAPPQDLARSMSQPTFQRITPRTNQPQGLPGAYGNYGVCVPYSHKRPRTDSAESSNSGSNASPPERARNIIVPSTGSLSKHLSPHIPPTFSRSSSMSSDSSQQRRPGPIHRSISPAGNSRMHSSPGPTKVPPANQDLGAILSHLMSGSSNQTPDEAAQTIANVAAQLARVAETLKR
ncbi:hypothetical protein P389DRAFT_2550 [Cystobasidium minutum MCA 4210]|uniref:uncharacterized protein n=1 Tax=Cystobasidium minutum MCA 4210 TaxID=1397322 RepID=UPI0034CDC099|eukprot:jgi/Rhomi1/2550/CE2549_224